MEPFKTAYGDKLKVTLICKDVSRTQQNLKEETDINFIVNKYHQRVMESHEKMFHGEYGNFQEIDYHEAMNTCVEAQQMFDSLPSKTRKRFDNDPGDFLEFVADEKNHAEMREMGLMPKLPVEGHIEPAAGITEPPPPETPPPE